VDDWWSCRGSAFRIMLWVWISKVMSVFDWSKPLGKPLCITESFGEEEGWEPWTNSFAMLTMSTELLDPGGDESMGGSVESVTLLIEVCRVLPRLLLEICKIPS